MPLVIVPLIALSFLVMWVALYGMQRGNQNWLQPLVTALAHPQGGFLKRTALKALGAVVGGIAWVVREVTHYLSVAASHGMAAVSHWLDGLAGWVAHLVTATGQFAEDVAHGFERLVTHTIPHEIHAATRPLWRGIDHLERDLTRLRERLHAFERGIDRLIAHRIMPAIRAVEHAIAVTLPRELGRIRSRVGTLEHDLRHPSRAWLKRLAVSMWGVALLGLLLRTLARRFPWLFCRKTANVGRALCGLDQGLLSSFLLDVVAIAGAISVVEMAKELQKLEPEALGILKLGIRELNDL